jgi:hypothetical protein
VLAAFSVPLRLLASFELAYVVRKKRSSNFFCMTFDQGHRKKEGTCSSLVRYSVWLVAFLLIFVSTIANAEHILAPSGRSYSSTTRFSSKTLDPSRYAVTFTLSDFVDVVPEAMSVAFLFFVGLSLWRYGTAQSMDVSATAINKWFMLTAATVSLLLAWLLQPADWHVPYAYNGCALAVATALTLTGSLIDHNLKELNRLNASITADNAKSVPSEPEALPPRFRSNSRDLSRPRRHSALGSFRLRGTEGKSSAGGGDGATLRPAMSMPAWAQPGGRRGSGDKDSPRRSPSRFAVWALGSPRSAAGAAGAAAAGASAGGGAGEAASGDEGEGGPTPLKIPGPAVPGVRFAAVDSRGRGTSGGSRSARAGGRAVPSADTTSEGEEDAVEVHGTHVGDVGMLPESVRRPLPDGPRPPEEFVGVNPMRVLG